MTDITNAIAAAPIVTALQPYITAVVGSAITALIGVAVAAFTKWTGVEVSAAYTEAIERAAATEAGKLIAGAADNLSNTSIPVGSPLVAEAVERILTADHLQKPIAATGMTPDRLASIVAGEIGKLQAQTPTVSGPQSETQRTLSIE